MIAAPAIWLVIRAKAVHHHHPRPAHHRKRHHRVVSRALVAVAAARRELGTPYVWGGAAPGGFDCSGLVQWVYRQAGVFLPRTTWSQRYAGRWAPLDRLHPGDLVFSNGGEHVGLYIGGGEVIQAPYTGTVVQVSPLYAFGAEFARRVA